MATSFSALRGSRTRGFVPLRNSIQTTLGLSPQVKSGQVGTKDRISSTRAESVIGLTDKLLAKSPEVMLQRCCSGKGGGEVIK